MIQRWLETRRKEFPQEIALLLANITVNGSFNAAGLKNKRKY
ncbi:TetR family transcriptional regulator [Solibacillus ferritrahens]